VEIISHGAKNWEHRRQKNGSRENADENNKI
jgi:hypothetical protein